jgi:hypothetical protein
MLSLGTDPTEERILSFVHRYGLLGYDSLSAGRNRSTQRDRRQRGDPLIWIQAHARTVRDTLDLCLLLQKDLRNDFSALLKRPWSCGRRMLEPTPSKTFKAGIARYRVEQVINGNLQNVRDEFRFEGGGRTGLRLSWNALIELVYWELRRAIHGGYRLRLCAYRGCGRVFVPAHGLQRFCPRQNWWGSVSFAKGEESPCATADRQARWRQRERVRNARRSSRPRPRRRSAKKRANRGPRNA